MDTDRAKVYSELRERASNTPLALICQDRRGNSILGKLESEQRFGGHYDRVYPELFYYPESLGRIRPGRTIILETSTGNAGISTAAVGTALGYETHLGVPSCIDAARKSAIVENGGILHEVEGDYVNAFPAFIMEFIKSHRGTFPLNHSMGRNGGNNEITLKSLEAIADEALRDVKDMGFSRVDYFVAGVGNGSTLLGPGRVFRRNGTRVYGAEPLSSAVLWNELNPFRYKQEYGVPYGSMPVHGVYGLSYPGIDFPHIRNSVNVVDGSILVGDKEMLRQMRGIMSRRLWDHIPGRQIANFDRTPPWDEVHGSLNEALVRQGYNPVGKSSALCFAAALELAKRAVNSTIVFICYDQAKRYDAVKAA